MSLLDRLRIGSLTKTTKTRIKPQIDISRFKRFNQKQSSGVMFSQIPQAIQKQVQMAKAQKLQPQRIRPPALTIQQKHAQVIRNISKSTQVSSHKGLIAPSLQPPRPAPVSRPLPQKPLPNIRIKARARANILPLPPRTVVQKRINVSLVTQQANKIKNIGKGRILIMVAAGPSINEVNFDKLKGHSLIDFMCVNQPYKAVWPSKFWAFCDHTQYRRNVDIWNQYNGIIINSTNVRARKENQIVLRNKPGKGFAKDINGGYHIGRSSTYANMQAVYYMNYDKVYIFGVDMCGINGRMHYYGQNPDVNNDAREKRFAAEAEHYWFAAHNLSESERQRFTFCSSYLKWPFVKHFPRLDHVTAVDTILNVANMGSKDKSQIEGENDEKPQPSS
jgi:hypothetical protein